MLEQGRGLAGSEGRLPAARTGGPQLALARTGEAGLGQGGT